MGVKEEEAPTLTKADRHAVCYDTTQITCPTSGSNPKPGSTAIALIAKAVSDMPETDLNAVLAKCCAVTKMMVGQAGYAPIWNEQASRLMFDDLDYMDLIQIVATVIQDNIGNFSDALPSMSSGRAG